MARSDTEVRLIHKAQQLAESALEGVEFTSVFEVFDDLTDEDGSEILRLVQSAKVVIE